MPSMVGSTSFSMKNERLHLIAGLNNIQHILTNQSVPSQMHCMEKRELSAQLQEGAGNCSHTDVGSSLFHPPSAWGWVLEQLTLLSVSLSLVPPPHMQENYTVFSLQAPGPKHSLRQAFFYFEICIPQSSVRYGSWLLDSNFLDRSFLMHL